MSGSSPLVRGKQLHNETDTELIRIIPACAGQTTSSSIPLCHCADHPRLCGANSPSHAPVASGHGSSPLVRGKHQLVALIHSQIRIIPACAGQTVVCCIRSSPSADHPRLCGANRDSNNKEMACAGSSPLVRGKRRGTRGRYPRRRIIPACAGQTPARNPTTSKSSDHPRLCGANCTSLVMRAYSTGSSPLVRGKHTHMRPRAMDVRIIPACAGQTVGPMPRSRR